MKFILLTFILGLPASLLAAEAKTTFKQLLASDRLQLSRADHIIAENLVGMIKLVEKGFVQQEILGKLTVETARSKHFAPFHAWLLSLQEVARLKETPELLTHCWSFSTPKATLPLEKRLERLVGNLCRERALEAIGREIDKTKVLSDSAAAFIQGNMKFFLTRKNKKNFAFFIQSQATRPEILKRLSQEVTAYSVQHDIVPSHEVLKDIEINEQITKLIQSKGFNPLQHQNVFYAEYGKLIEQGYRTLDKAPEEKKVRDHFKHLKNYLELNQDHLPMGLCLSRLNDLSKSVSRNGFKDLAREIFRFIVKKNHRDIHEDALYFYLWTYLTTNDFKGALKVAEENQLLKGRFDIVDPRLRFWIAHALEMTDKKDEAVALYEHIVTGNPLSYYAIMSNKKLQTLRPESPAVRFYVESVGQPGGTVGFSLASLDDDHVSSLVRLRAWAKMDNAMMVRLELKRLARHSQPNLVTRHPSDLQLQARSDLHLLNAMLIQESQNYLATFRYLYQVMDKKEIVFNRSLLEVLYPKPYLEDLTKVLKNDSLDPLVVLSLIRQESVFNPQARSSVGARGLMQLMPTTARRLKSSVRDVHLVNPQTNIELGVKYFKGLMKRYDGNLVYVLGAYNAGESRVERWRNLYFETDESIIKNIEQIPFLETRNYVKLIFRNIFFYKLLLENKELADSGEPNKIFDVNLGFNR